MKSFWITVLLLALMTGGVIANHLYIKEVFDTMEARLDTLPDVGESDCLSRAEELTAYWEEQVDLVSLSVSYTIVDRISEHAETLVACAECNDLFGYRTARVLLLDAIGDMMRFEKPSLGTLF